MHKCKRNDTSSSVFFYEFSHVLSPNSSPYGGFNPREHSLNLTKPNLTYT